MTILLSTTFSIHQVNKYSVLISEYTPLCTLIYTALFIRFIPTYIILYLHNKKGTIVKFQAYFQSPDLLDEDPKDDFKKWWSFLPPPSSGPCKCLPGKRENRENLLRERRRGGGEATDGERGGVTAEREERGRKGQQKRESWAGF